MTRQFGDSRRQLFEDANECLGPDRVRIGLAAVRLSVELAAVVNARIEMAERDAESPGNFRKQRAHRLLLMNVLVRVAMRGRLADEPHETIELAMNFVAERISIF